MTVFRSLKFQALLGLLLICSAAAFLKIPHYQVQDYNSDYETYVETARFFTTQNDAGIFPQRLLKPLAPLATAVGFGITGDYMSAFMLQVVIFYLLLAIVTFIFFEEFFYGDVLMAFLGSFLFLLSYPVLRYGLAPYTETGAWFFYVLALYFALRYFRKPTVSLALLSATVSSIGFLWKEYSAVSFLVLLTLIFFNHEQEKKEKIKSLVWSIIIFGAISLAWQVYVYLTFHYTYLDWYKEGGEVGFKTQFTAFNLMKSFFALLMVAWFLVPFGAIETFKKKTAERFFLVIALAWPCLFFFWGYVSSRLFYIIALPLVCLAMIGMKKIGVKNWQMVSMTAIILIFNILWLIYSY